MPDRPDNVAPTPALPRARVRGWAWLLSLFALFSNVAWADVDVPAPRGWATDANAPREALAEAESWAQATGLEASQVASPDEHDAFVENLVVLVGRRPLHPQVLADESTALAALTEVAGGIFDASSAPIEHELIEAGGTLVERARWRVEGTTWDLLLVPSASEHAIVVLKTSSANSSLHGDLISELVDGLEGASAPLRPFPLSIWRWCLLIGALMLAAAAHLIALRREGVDGDHLAASRKSSLAVAVIAILATGVVYLALADRTSALTLAGTSTRAVALELLGAGIVAALVLMVLGRLLGGRPERVESAPRTGIFSADAVGSSDARVTAAPERSGSPVPRRLGPDADAELGSKSREPAGPQGPGRPRGN